MPKGVNVSEYDFDHPNSLDFVSFRNCLKDLINTGKTLIPVYSFVTCSRVEGSFDELECGDIIIIEGILGIYDAGIRNLCDLKIFIHCEADIALARRILRDIKERKRDVK